MDKGILSVFVFLGVALLLTIVGGVTDSIATNYMRLKAIDRVLTTVDNAVNAGLITKEDFMKEMNEFALSLKKEKENE